MCQEYAPEVEKMKAEAQERKKKAGKEKGKEGGCGKKKTIRNKLRKGILCPCVRLLIKEQRQQERIEGIFRLPIKCLDEFPV